MRLWSEQMGSRNCVVNILDVFASMVHHGIKLTWTSVSSRLNLFRIQLQSCSCRRMCTAGKVHRSCRTCLGSNCSAQSGAHMSCLHE